MIDVSLTSQLNGIGIVPWHCGQLALNWHLYYQAAFHEDGFNQTAYRDQSLTHDNSWTIGRNCLEKILAGTGQKWASGCSNNVTSQASQLQCLGIIHSTISFTSLDVTSKAAQNTKIFRKSIHIYLSTAEVLCSSSCRLLCILFVL